MSASSEFVASWGPLALEVQHREVAGGGGPTLRISDQRDKRELLRFDCFRRGAHFHIDPSGRDEIAKIDPNVDPVGWTMNVLGSEFRVYLEKAGHSDPAEPVAPAQLTAIESALRNPPVDLDHIDQGRMHSRLSEKWHFYPPDLLPAWVAEMDFPLAGPIREVLQRAIDKDDFGYPAPLKDAGIREAFASRMAARFGWQVDPRHVEVLSDVVQGLFLGLETLSEAGQGAIVQTPIYPPFLHSVRGTGRRLVENRLLPDPTSGRFEIDFDALDHAIDAGTKMLLFCNPHNPSGRVFGRAELEGLAERVLRHDLFVSSDEIHADIVYDQREFIPFASLAPEIEARTLTLTSASKAFNIPGLRCAVAHLGSPELRKRFLKVPRHFRGGIGILGLSATLAAWRHSDPWLDSVRSYLESNRSFLASALDKRFPEIRHYAPEATYLAWLDCKELDLPETPSRFFARHGKVALSEGGTFGPGWEQHVRLNFATSRAILEQVLERMAHALDTR